MVSFIEVSCVWCFNFSKNVFHRFFVSVLVLRDTGHIRLRSLCLEALGILPLALKSSSFTGNVSKLAGPGLFF